MFLHSGRRTVVVGSRADRERGKSGSIVLRVARLPGAQAELKPCPRAHLISRGLLECPHAVEGRSRIFTESAVPGVAVSKDQRVENGFGSARLGCFICAAAAIRVVRSDLFPKPHPLRHIIEEFPFAAGRGVLTQRLTKGAGVIVDATNLIESERVMFYGIAEKLGARLIIVRLTAAPAVVRERLRRRSLEVGAGPAGVEVYERMRRIRQRITQPHLIVDTTAGIEAAVEAVAREIEG